MTEQNKTQPSRIKQAPRAQDKKLRRKLKNLDERHKKATTRVKDAEILHDATGGLLEPETELERTYKVRQDDIAKATAIETAQKKFELNLPDQLGPYLCEYTRNGRELLLAGAKGHVATMDWREGKLHCELVSKKLQSASSLHVLTGLRQQLGETILDAKWLHNYQFFALAQKKYVYIYDSNGVELHCLRKHREVIHMEFLPYHFLLATLVRILFLFLSLSSPRALH